MEWQAVFTLFVVVCTLIAMVREVAPADMVMMAALFARRTSIAPSRLLIPLS